MHKNLHKFSKILFLYFAIFLFKPYQTQAQAGAALNFDGSNDYVSIPNTINGSIGNFITVEGWFNLTGGSTPAMLIGESFLGDGRIKFCLVNNGANNVFAGFYDGGSFGWRQSPTVAIPAATWTHIAATFDQINIRIYVNGTLSITYNPGVGFLPPGIEPWFLGARWDAITCCPNYQASVPFL